MGVEDPEEAHWDEKAAAIHTGVQGESRPGRAHRDAFTDTMHLARSQQLSAYDATYLELAMRRILPLATLDQKLRTAAKSLGVAVYGVR